MAIKCNHELEPIHIIITYRSIFMCVSVFVINTQRTNKSIKIKFLCFSCRRSQSNKHFACPWFWKKSITFLLWIMVIWMYYHRIFIGKSCWFAGYQRDRNWHLKREMPELSSACSCQPEFVPGTWRSSSLQSARYTLPSTKELLNTYFSRNFIFSAPAL